ncbi:MAG: hypothetical protein MI799_18395 [Desulfobacterales bacterium]|nr:hypothetical protein [Desulfobacterales bacterium]
MIQQRPLCVCEIKDGLGIAHSAANKCLTIPDDTDMVKGVRDGCGLIIPWLRAADLPLPQA